MDTVISLLKTEAAPASEAASILEQSLPQSLEDLKLPEPVVANLTLKHCLSMDIFTLKDLVECLKVSPSILTKVLDYLKKDKFIDSRGVDPFGSGVSSMTLTHRYTLTEAGKKKAAILREYDAYVGPVPVALEDYWQQVKKQSISIARLSPAQLNRAFQGMVVPPEMLDELGVAAVSGKPLFLYGPPGNGKTSIALRLGKVWEDEVLVPYAIYVTGNVIRVFDEVNHIPVPNDSGDAEGGDRRWVRCRRPAIIAGGELTLEMLDLSYKPALKYYEAPLQLKANNGMFVIDDFGRQQISPQELLNRWIMPLENKQDFLRLSSGQKFPVPFDQFIVFSTNLEPRTLVDEAFLRRIRSKVKVNYVTREQFLEIFQLCCREYEVAYNAEAVEYLLSRYYETGQHPMNGCHPRDLIEQILDFASFHQTPAVLNRESLDRACHTYFVD